MNKLLFTLLFCFSCASLIFAHSLKISGRITDAQSKAPLEFANIVLTTADTTFVGGATSNINGDFLVENVVPGDYRLVVSSVGYKTSETVLQGVDEVVNLGSLELEENSVLLDEVTVAASNEKSNSDRKIVFPSDKQKKASSNGIELLKQIALPRLQVNALQRTLSVPGGGEVQLRINGIIATNEEVIALLPEDIIKIEYHDNRVYVTVMQLLYWITLQNVKYPEVMCRSTLPMRSMPYGEKISCRPRLIIRNQSFHFRIVLLHVIFIRCGAKTKRNSILEMAK